MVTENSYWGQVCILLTRVSTGKQDYTPQNFDLKRFAESLGYTKCIEISTKESAFRTFESKEGFNMVVDYIKENPKCRTIFITELNRIGRNRKIITDIEYYLKKEKIQLFVKDSGLKLFDDFGNINESNQLMFSIYASLAESEMRTKKERFSRSKRKLFSEGISVTGKVLYGYDRVLNPILNKNVYQINKQQAEQINTVFDWYINGIDNDLSKSSISLITLECIKKGFDKYFHSKRNVNKLLKEEGYTGFKITNNRRKNSAYWDYKELDQPPYIFSSNMEIKYPVILSKQVFNAVQTKLSSYSTRLQRNINNNTFTDTCNKHITILSKSIICPICGHFYRGEYRKKDNILKHFYRCSHSKALIEKCTNKSTLSMLLIDSVVWCFIKDNISNLIDKINSFYNNTDKEDIIIQIENLNSKIQDFEEEKEGENVIFRASFKKTNNRDKVISDYNSRIESIDNKIEKIKHIISDRKKVLADIELNYNKDLKKEIENKINEIEQSKDEIKKYIRLLIKKIIPLYNNVQYTVLNLKNIDSLGYSLIDNNSFDFDGLPNMKNNIIETDYFLIINKKDNNRIKVKVIENNSNLKFENDSFNFNGHIYTIEKLFLYDCLDILEEPFLSLPKNIRLNMEENSIFYSLKDLEYKRFPNDLYKYDIE